MKNYDYLIVGSGLFGSVFAYEMTKIGKRCLVIEKSNHIGGNCFTENKDGINIHVYGPHIFHTNDEFLWDYVKQFAKFNNYVHRPKVRFGNKIYSFPINLLTLQQLWGVTTPSQASEILDSKRVHIENPSNLEEWALSQVGQEIYDIFIKGYTSKQWGTHPTELPTSIIKRIPIRDNFNDSYYFDSYQGIPIGGYTQIFENMLRGVEVRPNVNYFDDKDYFNGLADKVVYTGKIDEFFDYKYGHLDYRTLKFEHKFLEISDYQGCSQVNYGEMDVPYTRITEHKHFEFMNQKHTWITKEYSKKYELGDIPYYPINDDINQKIFNKYREESKSYDTTIFGGRLAEYRYYDMHQVIASSLTKFKKEKESFRV